VSASPRTPISAATTKSGTNPSKRESAMPVGGPTAIAMLPDMPKRPRVSARRAGDARSAAIAVAAVGYTPMPAPWNSRASVIDTTPALTP
jgi:hypothetical protein